MADRHLRARSNIREAEQCDENPLDCVAASVASRILRVARLDARASVPPLTRPPRPGSLPLGFHRGSPSIGGVLKDARTLPGTRNGMAYAADSSFVAGTLALLPPPLSLSNLPLVLNL